MTNGEYILSLIPNGEVSECDYPQLREYANKHFLEISKEWWNAEHSDKSIPQGVWIDETISWKCSNCNYGVNPWNNTRYCPNCGAYMKGDNN